MVKFKAVLKQFAEQGEKTGWTYIEIPANIAARIKHGNKKTFRVKGKLDNYPVKAVALMPMGDGNFIMAINAQMRKGIKKTKGAAVEAQLEEDHEKIKPPAELIECFKDDIEAKHFFDTLTYGHQNYFTKWIESAKTVATKTKRIAQALNALSRRMDFASMLRSIKQDREMLDRKR